LVIAKEFQLGLEGLLDGPLDDGLANLDGQRLDGIEVDVQPRPFLAIGAPGDNFSPPVRHVAEVGPILGLSLGERHDESILELGEREKLGKSS
jgi:hypothetical protein